MTGISQCFYNGQVITADKNGAVYSAVGVEDGQIAAAGSEHEVQHALPKDAEMINLHGRTLMPGFIDAHAHIELQGTNMLSVDCKTVETIEEMKERLAERASQTPEGEWIRGWGYNDKRLAERRHPTKDDLDDVTTEHPMIVARTCNHISVVNSKALELYGLSESDPDPPGGKLGRSNGRLNGQLYESIHMAVYEFSQYGEKEIIAGYEQASRHYAAHGITSLHEAGAYGNDHFRWLYKGVAGKVIQQRLYVVMGSLSRSKEVLETAVKGGMMTGVGDEYYKVGPAKLFIDGSSSGPTAATRAPYTSHPEDSGILYYSQEELEETLVQAAGKGFQITSHAVGDLAIEMLLTCIEAAAPVSEPDIRHRIEHAAIAPADLQERMARTHAVPVLNPAFIYEFGDGYVNDYGSRIEEMFPAKDMLEQGIVPAFGSDNPITTVNPLIGLYAAVTRKSRSGHKVGSNQAVSVMEAIRMYTINAAYAGHMETFTGSIEPGKKADITILDRPILDVDPETIKDINIDRTIVEGRTIYIRTSS